MKKFFDRVDAVVQNGKRVVDFIRALSDGYNAFHKSWIESAPALTTPKSEGSTDAAVLN